jgi:hypothetical protein
MLAGEGRKPMGTVDGEQSFEKWEGKGQCGQMWPENDAEAI